MIKDKKILIFILVIFFIFLSACISVYFIYIKGDEPKTAYIYSDGELIKEINLEDISENYSFKIESNNGGYNIIKVENGRICVTEASCPDKVCVKTGYTDNIALPIACLPNKLLIKISGKKSDDPDLIVFENNQRNDNSL